MKRLDLKNLREKILDLRRDVICMMRLKFIAIAMAILITVFIVMLSAINMIMNTVSQSQSMKLIQQIAQSERYNSVNNHFDNVPPEWAEGETPPEKPDGEDIPPPTSTDASSGNADDSAEADITVTPLALYWGDWRNRDDDDRDDNPWQQQPWQQPTQSQTEEANEAQSTNDWHNRPGQNGWDRPPQETDENGETLPPPWERERPTEDGPPPWETEAPTAGVTDPPPSEMPPEQPPEETPPPDATEPPEEVTPEPAVPAQADPVTEETTVLTESETDPETTVTEETTTEPETPVEDTTHNDQPPEPREPRMDRWNVPITIDHFAIMVDQDGGFLGLRNTEDYTDEEAEEIMNGILGRNRTQGMYGWLQYCTAQKSYGTLIVITDKTSDQGLLNNLFRTTVILGILMLLLLLAILIFTSHWITLPVQQAFKRQKQFVSDAGHELKTPIAVLTTNADILQDEIGENKWLVYMQEQIGRMNQLVGDLLRLARMDNAAQDNHFEDFDLSMAVAATTLPFESAAFEQHKTLEMDVQPGVHYRGSEQHIRQLCAIFIDNALKYSNDNGIIKVTLLQRGDHQVIEFYNTGCEISQSETEKIFERFYRGDKARNSTKKSGYGLGLAIAKSIMDVHKIKIQVTCEQGRWIRFLLTL